MKGWPHSCVYSFCLPCVFNFWPRTWFLDRKTIFWTEKHDFWTEKRDCWGLELTTFGFNRCKMISAARLTTFWGLEALKPSINTSFFDFSDRNKFNKSKHIYNYIIRRPSARRVREIKRYEAKRVGRGFSVRRRQKPPQAVPGQPRPCQAVPGQPRPCQAVLVAFWS